MAVEVVVALLGDPTQAWGDMLTPDSLELPYSDLRKVVLTVSERQTLSEVLERAAREFHLPVDLGDPSAFIAFSRDDAEKGITWGGMSTEVVLIDEAGRASWGHYYKDVRYDELLRAAEAGAVEGDPRRPYLILQPEIGNGVVPDWTELLQAWDSIVRPIVDEVLDWFVKGGAFYGGVQALERVADLLPRSIGALRRNTSYWLQREGTPDRLSQFLARDAWSVEGAARLLGCSTEDASWLLGLHGFSYDETALVWRRIADPAAEFLRGTQEILLAEVGLDVDREALSGKIRQRTEELARTGIAPTVVYDWEYEQDLPTTTSPTLVKFGLASFYRGLRERLKGAWRR